jgi:hypothetical protein
MTHSNENHELEDQPHGLPAVFVVTEVVLLELAPSVLGGSVKAIRRRIEDKVWREGREYHRRGGRIWIDLRGVAAWVRGDAEAA